MPTDSRSALSTARLDPESLDVAELKQRLLVTQAVEAARTIAEGVVTDPREADVGSVLGFGFAPFTGGAISYIDGMGAKAFVAQCVSLLRDLSKRGVALVFVTHDPHLAEALGEESIVLDAGAVIARGGVSEGLEAYHALYGHR